MLVFLFLDNTTWKAFEAESLPVKPEICPLTWDKCEDKSQFRDLRYVCKCRAKEIDYTNAIASLKEKALPVGNPEAIEAFEYKKGRLHLHSVDKFHHIEVKDGEFYEWPGEAEKKEILSEGWVPTYNDPDNSGWLPNAEPIEVYVLTLPVVEPALPDMKEPNNFCVTKPSTCTMNYCDENGCQDRERNLAEPAVDVPLKEEEKLSQIQVDYYEDKLEQMQRSLNSYFEENLKLKEALKSIAEENYDDDDKKLIS
jgi:hypothetical protein